MNYVRNVIVLHSSFNVRVYAASAFSEIMFAPLLRLCTRHFPLFLQAKLDIYLGLEVDSWTDN